MNIIKHIILFYTIIPILISCKQNKHEEVKDFTINNILQHEINLIIEKEDSLLKIDNIHDRHKVFKIVFYKKGNENYISIALFFNSYNSKTLNGYLNYRNVILTFYGKEITTSNKFINWNKLQQGEIRELTDDDHAKWQEKVPPPPPPPREILRREYLIINNDSLQLVYQGY